MYAIIVTGGKQYKAEVNKPLYIEKLNANINDKVTFDKVLLVKGDKLLVGKPYLDKVTVTATVKKQGKERKVVTFKYKPKKHSHQKKGHRQPYTMVNIDSINI